MAASTTSSLDIHASECRDLVLRIARHGDWNTILAGVQADDAQQLANMLDSMVHDEGATLRANDNEFILSLIAALAKDFHVIPQYHVPIGVQFSDIPYWGGGNADVYRGDYHGNAVFVKAVRSFNERSNMRMLREHMKDFVIWAHLSHPNILPFYGVFPHGEALRVCLVSPEITKGNLHVYLQTNPGTSPLSLLSDTLAGLQYLHCRNIVHGNLKTSNVLLTNEGRALVADFGISYVVKASGLNISQSTTSTVRYTAPELFEGEGDVPTTLKSDIWSFSCVCCEAYTRKIPFSRYRQDHSIILALARGKNPYRLDPQAGISGQMWEMVNECWSRTPSNRPTCDKIRSKYFGAEDDRPVTNSQMTADRDAYWKTVRANSSAINYERVRHILRQAETPPRRWFASLRG